MEIEVEVEVIGLELELELELILGRGGVREDWVVIWDEDEVVWTVLVRGGYLWIWVEFRG